MTYEVGKWYGWNGGECPVHHETVVEWVTKQASGSGKAGVYSWGVDDHENCIILAFRVIKEYKEPREFWLHEPSGKFQTEACARGCCIHVREVIE